MPQYLQFSVYFSNKALVNSSSRMYSCFRTVRSFWVSLWHSTVCFMFKTSAGLACIHLNVVSVFIKLGPAEQDTWTDSYWGRLCVECAHHVYVYLWMCVWLYVCGPCIRMDWRPTRTSVFAWQLHRSHPHSRYMLPEQMGWEPRISFYSELSPFIKYTRTEQLLWLSVPIMFLVHQGSSNISLEGHSAAELSSNPDQTHPPVMF